MNSQTKYENALSNKNQATAKKTDIVLARNAEKEAAIKMVIAKNDATIHNHKDWCASFGSFLAWIFIAFEVLLYPAKWYCKDYEKKEVIEADTKIGIKNGTASDTHTPSNDTNTTDKAKDTEKTTKDGKNTSKTADIGRQVSEKEGAFAYGTDSKGIQIKMGNDGTDTANGTTKVCAFDGCKAPFLHKIHNQKFCSDSCRKKNHNALKNL